MPYLFPTRFDCAPTSWSTDQDRCDGSKTTSCVDDKPGNRFGETTEIHLLDQPQRDRRQRASGTHQIPILMSPLDPFWSVLAGIPNGDVFETCYARDTAMDSYNSRGNVAEPRSATEVHSSLDERAKACGRAVLFVLMIALLTSAMVALVLSGGL